MNDIIESDITEIVKTLNQLFIDNGVYIDSNSKQCCDCGKIKPLSDFSKELGIENTNRCSDCRFIYKSRIDLQRKLYLFISDTYPLKEDIPENLMSIREEVIKNKVNSIIKPEHIKMRAILMKLNKKLNNYNP